MLVEKDISRVNIGSYVVKILRQRGNDNDFTCGWIKDLKAIENLIDSGVERVLVDTRKVQSNNQVTLESHSREKSNELARVKRNPQSFAEKLSLAKELFEKASAVQQNLQDEVKKGESLNLDSVRSITEELSKRIYQNNDAIQCIVNYRRKSRYQVEHSVAVTIYILVFSRYLELDRSIAGELAIGAFIHDVGKVFIDTSILNKDRSVSVEEFELLKSHVNHSINITKSTYGVPKLAQQIVAQHHERLNGSGYPKGFDSRVISSYSQMLAICDIYDAITNSKVYKDKLSQVQAFNKLLKMANDNLLDPKLINSFIKCLGVYPIGSMVTLNSELLAIVESHNLKDPLRPKIRVLYDTKQNYFVKTSQLDLAHDKSLSIERLVDVSEFKLDINKIIEFVMLDR